MTESAAVAMYENQEAVEVMDDLAGKVDDGDGIVVAVIDTGVDFSHPLLDGRIVAGWDFVDGDNDPTDERDGLDGDNDGLVDEAYGHGTFVSSIVAAVAPDAQIMVVRVLEADGIADADRVAEAMAWAVDHGADIVNLSLGSEARSSVLRRLSRDGLLDEALFVAAAGNTAADTKSYPAAADDVISVTATDDHRKHRAWFAAYGDWVDVAVPGEDLIGAMAGGLLISWDGTSGATALVSGFAARELSTDPSLDPKDLRRFVVRSLAAPGLTGSHDRHD